MRSIENRIAKLEHAAVCGETPSYAALLQAEAAKSFILSVTHDCPPCRDRAAAKVLELGDGVSLPDEEALKVFILSVTHECPACRAKAAEKLLELEGNAVGG